ncbi:MAG: hypothetical protein PQJ59_00350 [Spirochaetales bacterium]|nr:hypothetical protein [Spirochaetales bacterium]
MTIDWELYLILEDIWRQEDFQRLAHINHHGNSVLEHSFKVTCLAWTLSKRWGWDRKSVARGAILHDFFLYDWKVKGSSGPRRSYEIWKMHGFTHPGQALRNSEDRFELNKRERDIIARHMFPLTPLPPRYRESWLVNICDKLVALGEIPLYLSWRKRKGTL